MSTWHTAIQYSVHYWDTADWNYKLLKAYQNNDTFFFKALHEEIADSRHFKKEMLGNSCIHQIRLSKLKADEAYRFRYQGSFCPFGINIIVSRTENNINLHFIKYQYTRDSIACRIIKEYDRKLTQEDINSLTASLNYAGFWGLKYDDGIHGGDGDNITIDGYIKGGTIYNRADKFTSVSRWNIYRLALSNTIALLFKLAHYKNDCL